MAIRMKTWLFIFSYFGFTWVHMLTSPRPNCYECDQSQSCNCAAKNLKQVPVVPANVLLLDLSFNDIELVEQNDLSSYTELKMLNLQKNKLRKIHEEAFDSQHNLEMLDLSFNELENISSNWFNRLKSLKHLNLLGNLYTTLGSVPLFQFVGNMGSLKFGNPSLKDVKKNVLNNLMQLDEMMFVGTNLTFYETGSFKLAQPIRTVSISLQDLFEKNPALVSKILQDISHPETSLTVRDVILTTYHSVQPFKEVRKGGTILLSMNNLSITDESVTSFLEVMNGSPLTYVGIENTELTGLGRWANASQAHFENLHNVFICNIQIQGFFSFSSMLDLGFLLKYPSKVSVINSTVFVMPCPTSILFKKIEYLDLSQNLLSDLTMQETLCKGKSPMLNLTTLNVSQNSLKSLELMSHLVANLARLTFLDLSHNNFMTMPQKCTWPASLRFLNLSATKLYRVTRCLPLSLTVLDLSKNDLTVFHHDLPNLVHLQISGNRFIRFPEGWRFPSLRVLLIQRNTLNMFNKSDLTGFKNLQYLEAGQNNFMCTCEFVSFFKSEVDHLVTLQDGHHNYVCDSPFTLRGHTVKSAQLSVFDCHMVPAVSILCALIVLAIVLFGVACHKLHVIWYLKMTMAWLRAKQKPAIHRGGEDICYDAFVSYSQLDAEWVEDILVPELESTQPPFSLCLHKRDFRPGHWIVDNIIDSIEKSYRTLFILSENFVTSEWCRYELDFSHFRIVDEHNDSAILILLEPISKETIPKRFCKLRKIMNSRTYLEWPQDEERREEFWNNLRAALMREGS